MLFAVLAAFSCARREESAYDSIKLVEDLLVDSLSYLQELSASAAGTCGAITLIGDPLLCLKTGEALMTSDGFDNGSGRSVSDGLPDFAGETVLLILDFADSIGCTSVLPADSLAFREAVVRNAVFALDTSCRVSPYDPDSTLPKTSPKVLLVCSPGLSQRGTADIRDFYSKIGCGVSILSSADSSFSFSGNCYRLLRSRNLFTHRIAYPKAKLYMTVPARSGQSGASLIEFSRRFVPEAFADTLQVLAPKIMESYVQNQYQP